MIDRGLKLKYEIISGLAGWIVMLFWNELTHWIGLAGGPGSALLFGDSWFVLINRKRKLTTFRLQIKHYIYA